MLFSNFLADRPCRIWTSISANADGPRDAVSCKIDHIALPTEYIITRQRASVDSKLYTNREMSVITIYLNDNAQTPLGRFAAYILYSQLCDKYSDKSNQWSLSLTVWQHSVSVCVCVSVILWYCIKTAKRKITQIMPHDRSRTLVYTDKRVARSLLFKFHVGLDFGLIGHPEGY